MIRKLIVAVALMAVPLFAQNTTQQNPSPGTTPGGMPQHHHKSAGMQSSDMRAMHEKHMQEMKQNLDKMKALLQDMKTNAAGLSGKEKAAMDANVQLWQMMIDHMEQMMNNMSMMMNMHGGMGQGGMMGMHGGMMQGQSGTTPKQTTPPPK